MFNSSRLKHWLPFMTQLMAALSLFANALLWGLPDGLAIVARNLATLTNESIHLGTTAVWMGWGISSLHLCIMAVGVWAMAGVFRLLANGDYFHPQVSVLLQRFGIALLLFGATSPVMRLLLVLIATFENPEGHRAISLSIVTNDFLAMLVGILMIMLAHAMRAAAAIAEDNRQIV